MFISLLFRTKIVPAHERFAHLLVEKPSVNESPIKKIASPADIRRHVQVTEAERVNQTSNEKFFEKNSIFNLVKKSFIKS
jgi:hypothetical protein